jgi:hypothetical protein
VDPRPRRRLSDELSAGSDRASLDPARRRGLRLLSWGVAAIVAVGGFAALRPDLSLHASGGLGALPTPTSSGGLAAVLWDARGDLVHDSVFVGAAVDRLRHERSGVARVFFAGWLPDGSRLVLAGTDVERGMVGTAVHALLVAPGQDVATAPVTEVAPLTDDQEVLVWAGRVGDDHVYAVALSRPGPVRFDVSPRLVFDDDGAPLRTWISEQSDNGQVLLDLGSQVDPVVAVQATGAGVFPIMQVSRVADPQRVTGPPPVVVGVSAASYQGPDPTLLIRGLRQAVAPLFDLSTTSARVLWSGAPWKQRRLALVLLTRPDGLRMQVLVGQQGNHEFPGGLRVLASRPPADPDDTPWLMEPLSPEDPTFLLCPTGPGTLLYDRPGQPVQRLTVQTGGAVVLVEPGPTAPSARGAHIRLQDPQGHLLIDTDLPGAGLDDPLALQPD